MLDKNVIDEYFRIYAPWESANTCCYLCKNCIDGCAWARELTPVEGWKAKATECSQRADGYKIYYCPEFVEGDAAEGREYDAGGLMNLLEAVYRHAAEDYKKAYKSKVKAENRNPTLFKKEIKNAKSTMLSCSFLLGDWTEKIEQMADEEMEG